jgi:competence ComEA-like helix-hairpin-helix protein
MDLQEKFNRAFGLTHTESRIVLLLAGSLLLGIGITLVKNTFAPEHRFDYSASDSVFAARSALLSPGDSAGRPPSSAAWERQGRKAKGEPLLNSIDINSATAEELLQLPGVGQMIAERIVLFREENGPFTAVEDLVHVKGIGQKKLARMAPYCTLGK